MGDCVFKTNNMLYILQQIKITGKKTNVYKIFVCILCSLTAFIPVLLNIAIKRKKLGNYTGLFF